MHKAGSSRVFNSETEKTWKTLSPYLRELGRLPSDYDCSTSSISRSDGELERVLSYAAGREAATMASTSPELLSHPGELGRAEEFAIRAQQLILQPILGHTKCNIKVTAQVIHLRRISCTAKPGCVEVKAVITSASNASVMFKFKAQNSPWYLHSMP
eukprot:jgi/Picre1/30841/NNA_006201.t1